MLENLEDLQNNFDEVQKIINNSVILDKDNE